MATILSTPPPRVDISEQPEEFKQSKVMSVEVLMIQINTGVATPRFFGKALGLQEDVCCITSSRGFWLCLRVRAPVLLDIGLSNTFHD
jgi:hypothetical protein